MRAASQHRNIKLRELCTRMTTDLTGQSPTIPELRPTGRDPGAEGPSKR
ncbi:hypothetical protein ACWD0J_15205 [Streptomyces sp. NPDC003011]